MKSFFKNLSVLTMGLLIYSCNEKISAELQDGASTTVPTATAPKEYYFKVTNNSAAVLNYVLHRSGPNRYGSKNWDCAIKSDNISFTSTLYVGEISTPHQEKFYDISCYFEAEELSMAFNGLSFKMEASKNTCDYVAYAPYSFVDAIPGATGAAWRGATCAEGMSSTDVVNLMSGSPVLGVDPNSGLVRHIGCEEMVDTNITVVANRKIQVIPEDDAYLCKFDYDTNGGGNGMNCDVGGMSYNLSEIFDGDPDPDITTPSIKPSFRAPYNCGGAIKNCIGGAIKHVSTLKDLAYGVEITDTQLNQPVSQTYTLPKFLTRGTSIDIANWRRGLASRDLSFMDYTSTYDMQWMNQKDYDPFIVEKFSMNQTPDSKTIIDFDGSNALAPVSNATWKSKIIESGYTATPYAADPFLGYNGARVNPLYTFYCLDTALEIKARIRMAVRDWDRVFPSSTQDMELISDLASSTLSRRQDLPNSEEELPNDPSPINRYNDFDDWDARVDMTRTPAGAFATGTHWKPTAGWWAPGIFPSLGSATSSSGN